MSTTGVVDAITQDWRGDTLSADAASGDTVLHVNDAGDFSEDAATVARYLVVGAETMPRQYVAVDMDADTVTLAATAGAALETGLPVVLWDPSVGPSGDRVVEYVASVVLDDGSGQMSAVVPHTLIPTSGVYALVGATVSVEDDASASGDWFIASVLGREPVQDASYLDFTASTITGALIRTAPSGARTEMSDLGPGYAGLEDMRFYTGHANEAKYGTLGVSGTGATGGVVLETRLYAPVLSGSATDAHITLETSDDPAYADSTVRVNADDVQLISNSGSGLGYAQVVNDHVEVGPLLWAPKIAHGMGGQIDVDSSLDMTGQAINGGVQLNGGPSLVGGATAAGGLTVSSGGLTVTGQVDLNDLAGTGSRTVVAGAGGVLSAPTSTRAKKKNIRALRLSDFPGLRRLTPKLFKWRDEEQGGTEDYAGFIAEEVEGLGLEPWVTRDRDGKLEGVRYDMLTAGLFALVHDQQEQIDRLEGRLAALEGSA